MTIDTEIRTREDLVELVNETGFLPFFTCRIEGFSLEENISYEAWYQGRWSGKTHWDAWDWKGQVLQNKELVLKGEKKAHDHYDHFSPEDIRRATGSSEEDRGSSH